MKIKILDYKEILEELSMSLGAFKEYLDGGRQDVLYNTDIFCENVRTTSIVEKDFSLFDRVDTIDDDTVIIFPIYLELLQFEESKMNIFARKIARCIEYFCNQFPNNKVIFFWNHDVDFRFYNSFVEKHRNAVIINYNTSEETQNDIVIPFWTMADITPMSEPKEIFACFAGNITHPLRHQLVQSIAGKREYLQINGLDYDQYRKTLSKSVFGLCPRGAGLSSYRFFECLHVNTIPVLFADDVILPYRDEINYEDMIVRIPESQASNFEEIDKTLKQIDTISMFKKINQERHRFTLLGVQKYVNERLISHPI